MSLGVKNGKNKAVSLTDDMSSIVKGSSPVEQATLAQACLRAVLSGHKKTSKSDGSELLPELWVNENEHTTLLAYVNPETKQTLVEINLELSEIVSTYLAAIESVDGLKHSRNNPANKLVGEGSAKQCLSVVMQLLYGLKDAVHRHVAVEEKRLVSGTFMNGLTPGQYEATYYSLVILAFFANYYFARPVRRHLDVVPVAGVRMGYQALSHSSCAADIEPPDLRSYRSTVRGSFSVSLGGGFCAAFIGMNNALTGYNSFTHVSNSLPAQIFGVVLAINALYSSTPTYYGAFQRVMLGDSSDIKVKSKALTGVYVTFSLLGCIGAALTPLALSDTSFAEDPVAFIAYLLVAMITIVGSAFLNIVTANNKANEHVEWFAKWGQKTTPEHDPVLAEVVEQTQVAGWKELGHSLWFGITFAGNAASMLATTLYTADRLGWTETVFGSIVAGVVSAGAMSSSILTCGNAVNSLGLTRDQQLTMVNGIKSIPGVERMLVFGGEQPVGIPKGAENTNSVVVDLIRDRSGSENGPDETGLQLAANF